MITILDEICLPAGELSSTIQLFESDYLPAAEERGLTLVAKWVSPPVAMHDRPNTLWLQWQVPDPESYWAAANGGQVEDVAAFWAKVGAIADTRRRHVMVPADTALPTRLENKLEDMQ
jgi:hypothetical protein